jgi:hypothetical protein
MSNSKDSDIQDSIEKIDSPPERNLLRKRKNKLIINIKKKAKMDDINLRQGELLDQICLLRDKQHQIDLQISQMEDDIRQIEMEKCKVIGHAWIPDLSYNSKEGEHICDRCGKFD